MTVSYSNLVFTSQGYGTFLKLLRRWVGSIYKLVWKELLIYVMVRSWRVRPTNKVPCLHFATLVLVDAFFT